MSCSPTVLRLLLISGYRSATVQVLVLHVSYDTSSSPNQSWHFSWGRNMCEKIEDTKLPVYLYSYSWLYNRSNCNCPTATQWVSSFFLNLFVRWLPLIAIASQSAPKDFVSDKSRAVCPCQCWSIYSSIHPSINQGSIHLSNASIDWNQAIEVEE